jgi:signal transduction histidine kinase
MTDASSKDAPEMLSEVERLRAEVERLTHERDLAYEMLNGLRHLGARVSFWDGVPERLSNLVSSIQQAFGYQVVALSLFEAGSLRRYAIVPSDAQLSTSVSPQEVEQAIVKNRPIIVSDGAENMLVVPLVVGMQRVGVLEMVSDAPLPAAWRHLWHALGSQIASQIVSGRLLEQLEEARRRHQLLYELTRHLTSGTNIDKMLTDVLALTISYVGADMGSAMLLDDQMQITNHLLVGQSSSPERRQEATQEVLESGLAQWVIEHKQATIVVDTTMDERWAHLPGDSDGIRSALSVPLRHGTRICGLLVLTHHEPDYFNRGHLSFLSSIADQAAITVENIFLLEQTRQRVDELGAINEISQAASSLHLNDVLRILAQRTAQALQVRRCTVFLLDETETQLVLRAINHPDIASGDLNLVVPTKTIPHIVETMRMRRPIQIPDIFADERLRFFWQEAQSLGIKAQLSVPLITKQRVIGVISIDRGASHAPFSEDEIVLCQTIAHQAANAIENARLYEEVQQRAERMSLVNRVSHDIGAILDIDQLLRKVARLIRETFECYHVAIGLVEGEELVFKAGINYLYRPVPRPNLSLRGEGEGIAGWVALHGRSLLVPEVREDPRYMEVPDLPNTRCELVVPLKVPVRTDEDGEGGYSIVGVLTMESNQADAFSSDDQVLLEALAAQVAVALEGARLFTRVQEERATLEALMNATSDAIIITNTEGHILFFNPAAQSAFLEGDTAEPRKVFTQVVHNDALLELWHEASLEHSRSAEVPLADGRTFYASMAQVADVGRVIVMQDITHFKRMDEIKSSFVSTVSHDLRSPLQVIQTSAELLPRLGKLNRDQSKATEHILAVVRRMANLVQHLLDIGRIEAGVGMEIEPCSMNEIATRAASVLRPLAEQKGLDFELNLPEALPMVKGNALRLEQVVSNLASNAIKFTPQGSVSVSTWSVEDHVLVEVRDTGIGIPPDAQKELFQKFYRVRTPETRAIEGTGLGLAIVKSIVESYGGQITVTSAPNEGSTFAVTLPIYQEEGEPVRA